MIAEMEKGIVAKLAAKLPDIKVEEFPDDPKNYRLTHPHGAVLVAYGGGRRKNPDVLAGTSQERRIEYQLTIKTRSLRSHTGAYAILEGIETALSGEPIEGARFYCILDRFEDVSSGVWTYLAVYAADIPWVSQAQFPDDVALALAAAKITATGGLEGDPPITVGE